MVSQAPTETHFLPIPPCSLWVTLDKRPCVFLAYLWARPLFLLTIFVFCNMPQTVGRVLPQYLSATAVRTFRSFTRISQLQPRGVFFCLSSFSWSCDIQVYSNRAHVTSTTEQKPRTPHTSSTSKPLSQYHGKKKSQWSLCEHTCKHACAHGMRVEVIEHSVWLHKEKPDKGYQWLKSSSGYCQEFK